MSLDIFELLIIGDSRVDVFLSKGEQVFGELGFGAHELCETGFLECEILERHGWLFGIEVEGFAVGIGGGHEAVHRPVTAFDGVFDAVLSFAHIDAVRDAGAVGDDERGAFVGFGFGEGFDGLVAVGAEGDGGDVNVAVCHGELSKVFFAAGFAARREFCDGATGSGLGGLTACVGIDFGVEDEDVDVSAEAEDVVETAVTDVISPAVAAHDPE